MIGGATIIIAFVSAIILSPPTALAMSSQSTSAVMSSIPKFSERKIVLLHLHDRAFFFSRLGALTLANKARYVLRHGYELAYHTPQHTDGLWKSVSCDSPEATTAPGTNLHAGETDRSSCVAPDNSFHIDRRAPTFGKIKLALAACKTRPGYWALWTDADAMIVNQTMVLESIIDDRYDMHITTDWLMINAGMILFKCSDWTQKFLQRVYDARQFDNARALDQSAFQHFFDTEPDMKSHLKNLPKHAMNVYTEEYQPGDFLLHMAGKLYEATTTGTNALAHQFDLLSMIDDYEDVAAFFRGPYLLNFYSGICNETDTRYEQLSDCKPEDPRRIQLEEPLIHMSSPNRYRHVGLRYYWLHRWTDKYDIKGWNDNRLIFDPSGRAFITTSHGNTKNNDHVNNGRQGHDEL